MPIIRARYPDNWNAITTGIKQAANWCCQQCDRYLVLALSAEGADEATLNPYAHKAIGVFQGYIRAIQDAAGIHPVGPGMAGSSQLGAIAPATSGAGGRSDGSQADDIQLAAREQEEQEEQEAVRRRREEIDAVFGN